MYVTVANNAFLLLIHYLKIITIDIIVCSIHSMWLKEVAISSGISFITQFYTSLCSPEACNNNKIIINALQYNKCIEDLPVTCAGSHAEEF